MYKGAELEKIMPHKRSMLLIDRVLFYDIENKILMAQVEISSRSMFFNEHSNAVPVWVGMEYMAQSIAALSAIYDKENNNPAKTLGFIIGARNYKCFADGFKNGATLHIKVEQLFLDTEIGSFKCEVFDKSGKILASTELNVFQPKNIEQFLNR